MTTPVENPALPLEIPEAAASETHPNPAERAFFDILAGPRQYSPGQITVGMLDDDGIYHPEARALIIREVTRADWLAYCLCTGCQFPEWGPFYYEISLD